MAADADREARRARAGARSSRGLADRQALHLRAQRLVSSTSPTSPSVRTASRPAVQPTATYVFPLAGARTRASGSISSLRRSTTPAGCSSRSPAASPPCSPARAADLGGEPLARHPASPPQHAGRRDSRRRPDRDPRRAHRSGKSRTSPQPSPAWPPGSRKQPSRTRDSRPSDACSSARSPTTCAHRSSRSAATSTRSRPASATPASGSTGRERKPSQIDRLVTSLFDYARAEIDERPNLQTTDLAEAVTDTTAGFELAADKRGITLRVDRHTGTPVTIDRDGFERALANVIDNALHHTPRGGAIEITCGEDTDGAFVRVVDDGPGIPPTYSPTSSSRWSAPTATATRTAERASDSPSPPACFETKTAQYTRQTRPNTARSSPSGCHGQSHSHHELGADDSRDLTSAPHEEPAARTHANSNRTRAGRARDCRKPPSGVGPRGGWPCIRDFSGLASALCCRQLGSLVRNHQRRA